MNIILGIDPGSRITGYGVIVKRGQSYECLSEGCIVMADLLWPERLAKIFKEIHQVVKQFRPQVFAVEQVFMHRNANAALKLGQARGAAIAAAATEHIPMAEYSARQVKQAVVGYGAAEKDQVQHMVTRLLNLPKAPKKDAADALAVALCHAHSYPLYHQQLQQSAAARRRV